VACKKKLYLSFGEDSVRNLRDVSYGSSESYGTQIREIKRKIQYLHQNATWIVDLNIEGVAHGNHVRRLPGNDLTTLRDTLSWLGERQISE
jgi:hypothetical protein